MQSLPKLLFISITSITSANTLAQTIYEPVVVTASRFEEKLSDTLASTTVISQEDIQNSTATTLKDLLRSVNGLTVKTSSSFGKLTSVFMRGTSSSHVLTMVDGVKLYSATSGGTAFQHIPLDQIDYIEIVRGPRSGLYGSEAIGGVIQIFTKKGSDKPAANFSIEQGSYNTSELNAGFSGKNGKLSYSLNANQFNTHGIDSIKHTSTNDDDGYNNQSLSTNLTYQSTKSSVYSLNIMNAQGSTLYDNCFHSITFASSDNCYSDFSQQTFSTKASFTPDGIWDANVILGYSKDLNDNFWEDEPNNTYITEHYSLSFQNNFQLTEDQLFLIGLDSTKDQVDATPYSVFDDTRDNHGIFISLKSEYSAITTDLSIRTDDNEQFDQHTTGTLSAGINLSNASKLYASYGTAFKAPSFNELYFPGYGNENLAPEESESLEIGYRQKLNSIQYELNLFSTTVENLIGPDGSFVAANISKAEIDGIEASVNTSVKNWKLDITTSYIEPLNKDASNYNKVLTARVKSSTTVNLSRDYSNTSLYFTLINQGERYADAANTDKIDSYTTLDTHIKHKLNKQMILSVKLNNIFDEDYVINAGFGNEYSTPGRSIFVSFNYKM